MTEFEFIRNLMNENSIAIDVYFIAYGEHEQFILEEYDGEGDVKNREVFELSEIFDLVDKIEEIVDLSNLTSEDVY